ncbi:hypothetical protein MSP8887_03938 [Marinomonas spartinae]|uniref:YgaP family membrane protein n=1 Tax=Marinomonas spartinae TaxID=1792290 RepID=UPI000808BF3C|nr:DUF2892 domain-containing protein [Marinomonas spartinae]SBS39674.1 hypothetical protein MSP8887_03938 [Marinomonas spartinae]
MKCNVGKTDRIARIIAGAIVLVLGVYFHSWWGLIGVVLIGTGIFKICPAYIPFGVSTCDKEE